MSLWQRLKDRIAGSTADDAPIEATEATPAPAAPVATEVTRRDALRALDEAGLHEELRRVRGSAEERDVLAFALEAPRGERVSLAIAELLVLRGEVDRAIGVLRPGSGTETLMLLAELQAERSDHAAAVATIERVLARSIETPGALERHALWRGLLGAERRKPTTKRDEATVATATVDSAAYRVLREVARGGAGTVYEAVDDALGRTVAFKVFHGRGDDAAALKVEVELAGRLGPRHAVRVFDASPRDGWLAMEWVPAGSLREWARRGPAQDGAPWVLPLAEALAALHAQGVVHGDVKPGNILLRDRAEPILTDFGIARFVGAPQAGGSAAFMSPARIAGAAVSFQDDLYGFGRVLEDMLRELPEQGPWERLAPTAGACLRGEVADARALVVAVGRALAG